MTTFELSRFADLMAEKIKLIRECEKIQRHFQAVQDAISRGDYDPFPPLLDMRFKGVPIDDLELYDLYALLDRIVDSDHYGITFIEIKVIWDGEK